MVLPWSRVLEWNYPWAKWFVGATCNIAYNCLDRHTNGWRRNKVAIIWVGENGEERIFTYGELLRQVNRCANALKALGLNKGDRVTIYLPKIPEQVVAMLACARPASFIASCIPDSVRRHWQAAFRMRRRVSSSPPTSATTAENHSAQTRGRRGRAILPSVEKVVVVRRDALSVALTAPKKSIGPIG